MEYLGVIGYATVGIFALLSVYLKVTTKVCRSQRDLQGKTAIVTGANTGIGLETAKDLARRKARVILACRTVSTAQRALQDIAASTGNSDLEVKQLDLGSFSSIRDFARDVLTTEKRLDILVNNAGVMIPPPNPGKTADGLEVIMGTNHFGTFLLTNLLLPLLKSSAPSRVVVVSSRAHERGRMDFTNMNGEKPANWITTYSMSKLGNVLFSNELAKRLEGTGVTVNSLHPGVVRTELLRDGYFIFKILYKTLGALFTKSAKDGAQTSIHVAVAEELEGVTGKYFSDCKEKKLEEHARDSNTARRLWLFSEKVTGLSQNVE